MEKIPKSDKKSPYVHIKEMNSKQDKFKQSDVKVFITYFCK